MNLGDIYKEFTDKSTLMLSIFDRNKTLLAIHNPNNNPLLKPEKLIIGKYLSEIIEDPEFFNAVNSCLDKTIETGEVNEVEHYIYANDMYYFYRFTSVEMSDGTIAVSSADISNTKSEELNEKMQINFLYTILDKIPTAVILKDCETKRYVFWNRHSEISTMISSQDAIGKVDAELFPTEVCQQFERSDNILLENREPQEAKQIIHLNGETYHSAVKKYIISINQKDYILGVRWDVTDLERERYKNQLIFDNVDVGFVFLSPDYKVVWENVSRVFNHPLTAAYTVGTVCYNGRHERGKPCDGCIMERALLSKKTEYRVINTPDGFHASITATPVYADGRNLGVVMKVEDITEKLRQERELKDAKERAEESDKLKSMFLANMSHEIRTPLNAIVGFSDLLIHSEDIEERQEFGGIIANNTNLLLGLINDILDLSKIEAGLFSLNEEYFEIDEICSELYSVFGRQMKESIKFEYIKPAKPVRVCLDKNRFRQILNNLLSNASKYTHQGVVTFGCEVVDNGIRVYVTDTGIGISEENKKMVFQRFKKFDDFAQGTGLGLSISKALVELQGGKIGFESELNRGSTFWMWVPCEMEVSKSIIIIKQK